MDRAGALLLVLVILVPLVSLIWIALVEGSVVFEVSKQEHTSLEKKDRQFIAGIISPRAWIKTLVLRNIAPRNTILLLGFLSDELFVPASTQHRQTTPEGKSEGRDINTSGKDSCDSMHAYVVAALAAQDQDPSWRPWVEAKDDPRNSDWSYPYAFISESITEARRRQVLEPDNQMVGAGETIDIWESHDSDDVIVDSEKFHDAQESQDDHHDTNVRDQRPPTETLLQVQTEIRELDDCNIACMQDIEPACWHEHLELKNLQVEVFPTGEKGQKAANGYAIGEVSAGTHEEQSTEQIRRNRVTLSMPLLDRGVLEGLIFSPFQHGDRRLSVVLNRNIYKYWARYAVVDLLPAVTCDGSRLPHFDWCEWFGGFLAVAELARKERKSVVSDTYYDTSLGLGRQWEDYIHLQKTSCKTVDAAEIAVDIHSCARSYRVLSKLDLGTLGIHKGWLSQQSMRMLKLQLQRAIMCGPEQNLASSATTLEPPGGDLRIEVQ